MDTIIMTVFCAAIVGVGGIIAGSIREIAASKTTNSILLEIADVVADVVESISQTYVDSLKASGNFDEDAQKKALKRAVSSCVVLLSQAAKDYITEVSGDMNAYLETKIEAEVRRQKRTVA